MNVYIKTGEPCNKYYSKTIQRRLRFIYRSLNIANNSVILDIGTGYGVYSNYLSGLSHQCIGIDIIRSYLKIAKKENRFSEYAQISADTIAFKNNSFDAVLLIEVIEHPPNDGKSINEVSRVLKAGGKLIVTAPNKRFPFETHGFHIGKRTYGTRGFGVPMLPLFPEFVRKHLANARVYTPTQITQLLESNNLEIINVDYIGPNFDTLSHYFPKLEFVFNRIHTLFTVLEESNWFKKNMPTMMILAQKR